MEKPELPDGLRHQLDSIIFSQVVPPSMVSDCVNEACPHKVLHHATAWPVCACCVGRYPADLVKACFDFPFNYGMELRSGLRIDFEQATIRGEWVHLDGVKLNACRSFQRGMQVHLADIVWVADWGS